MRYEEEQKNSTKSLLACAVLASVLGGVMPVYAEGETPVVQHRYQLVQGTEWHDGDAVPYGSVVKKADDGKYYLYEIRTGNDTPWGLVGRGIRTPVAEKQVTLQYDWHTADTTDGKNHLVLNTVSTGDITVIYDGTKVVDTHKTSIDSSVTAYVGAHIISEGEANIFGGAIRNGSDDGPNITADFIGNFVSGKKGIGGAIFNPNRKKIGCITGDFIGNYLLTVGGDTFGGAIINDGEINDIIGNFIGNYAVTSGANAEGGAICTGFMDPGTINNITGDFIGNYVSGGHMNKGGAICIHRGAIGNITGNFIGNYALGYDASGGAIYNGGTISNITGDFIGNYVSDGNGGGAIFNRGTIGCITGDFIGNYASDSSGAYSGAIYNQGGTMSILAGDRDVLFSDNRVSASDSTLARGGAIYNDMKMNLYAAAGHSITFAGDANDTNTDSIYNVGTLNINGTKNNYTGTVNLAKVEGSSNYGTMNINGGRVEAKGNITQNTVNLAADASLNVTGTLSMNNGHFTVKTDLANSSANCVTLGELVLNDNLTISVCDTDVVADKGSVTLDNIPVLTVNSGSLPEDKISSANVIVSNVLFAPTIMVNDKSVCLTKLEYTKIHHRYKLDGDVVKTGEVNGTITPWGLVGRGLSTDTGVPLQYNWDTNGLTKSESGTGDITVIYDGTKVVSERQTSINDSVTAYVGANGTSYGGALYNSYTQAKDIMADFIGNYVSSQTDIVYGGAIYNCINAQIGNITGDFIGNYASGYTVFGGAIYNYSSTINDITGDFIGNCASGSSANGGAIYNDGVTNLIVGNVTGDFIGNCASGSSANGGAIYNYGCSKIGNIIGDFIGNYASASDNAYGGAIRNINNAQIGNITGDFIGNYASGSSGARGGAIYNQGGTISILAGDRNVLFSGNRVSSSDKANAQGGAIYNDWSNNGSTVNLYAAAGHSITFEGDASDDNTDSIYNDGTLNINGTENNYTGTVNLANVDSDGTDGTMNINGGTVNGKGNITQNTLNISGGTLAVTGTLNVNNITFTLPTGVVDNSVIINATNAVSLSGVTVNVYLNNEEPDSITLISKVADSGTYNVYSGNSGTDANDDYEVKVENSALILKSLQSVWYTVGDDKHKFLPLAEAQSINDNSGEDVVLYRGAGDNNEYKGINITGALTVGAETETGKSFLVSGDLTAGEGVTIQAMNTLNVGAGNLKSAVTNNGTVNLGAGILASGITGSGTTKIVGNTTLEAKVNQGIIVDTGKTLTTAADNLGGDVTNTGNLKIAGTNTGTIAKSITGNGSLEFAQNVRMYGAISQSSITIDTNAALDVYNTLAVTSGSITNNGSICINAGNLRSDVTNSATGGTFTVGEYTMDNGGVYLYSSGTSESSTLTKTITNG